MRWTLPALLLTATLSPAAGPMQSVSALAFGPDGTLFVADPQAGAVLSVKTGDTSPAGQGDVTVEDLSAKLNTLFGGETAVADMKVNPASGNLYLAVRTGTGKDQTPALAKLTRTGELTKFEPKAVTTCKLSNAKNTQRQEAITYLGFADGKLLVAGLSNEEFASTFRVLPVPLPAETKDGTGVEIYHAAHRGALETRAPIRTFVPYTAGGVQYVMAAYTCTPLVRLAAADLQPGKKVKGTTIAELGNRNTPLDLIAYSKGGKEFLLLSNSARGVMKIPADPFAAAEALKEPVKDGGTAGVKFEPVTQLEGVVQLDKLDADRAVVVVQAGKVLSVKTVPLP